MRTGATQAVMASEHVHPDPIERPGVEGYTSDRGPGSYRSPTIDTLARCGGDTQAFAAACVSAVRDAVPPEARPLAVTVLGLTTDPTPLHAWPLGTPEPAWLRAANQLARRAYSEQSAVEAPVSGEDPAHPMAAVVMPLDNQEAAADADGPPLVIAVLVASRDSSALARLRDILSQARLARAAWCEHRRAVALSEQIRATSDAVGVLSAFNRQTRLHAAAFAFVNHLSRSIDAERVALGLIRGDRVQVLAISDAERVAHREGAVRALAHAMEEAIDQRASVAAPETPLVPPAVNRAARELADSNRTAVLAMPLYRGDESVGCLIIESISPQSLKQLATLRLTTELAGPRLVELQRDDRWIGAKIAAEARRSLAAVLGPRHTLAKLVTVLVSAALMASVFARVPRDAAGTFVIKAERTRVLAVPFDGFIDAVHAEPGDILAAGTPVFSMRTTDLRLSLTASERQAGAASAEAAAARAAGRPTDAELAETRAQEAEAAMKLAEERIRSAMVVAPTDGTLDAPQLTTLVGAAVRLGQQVATVLDERSLIAEIAVPERAAGGLEPDQAVTLAFASAPETAYRGIVREVAPVVELRDTGNVVICTVDLIDAPAGMRTGQTGVARVRTGAGRAIDVHTRAALDWVRLQFFRAL